MLADLWAYVQSSTVDPNENRVFSAQRLTHLVASHFSVPSFQLAEGRRDTDLKEVYIAPRGAAAVGKKSGDVVLHEGADAWLICLMPG